MGTTLAVPILHVEAMGSPAKSNPDVVLELMEAPEVDFELGKWLDGVQMARGR